MVLNHSAFTLEDLYHPELGHIISIVQYTCFIFNTLVFAFTSFVVLKKSPKEMNTYKYIMFAQIFWTYFVDVNMTIWQPIILFPYILTYSVGILKVGAASAWIGLEFQITIITSRAVKKLSFYDSLNYCTPVQTIIRKNAKKG
jgi:hypothetical protein